MNRDPDSDLVTIFQSGDLVALSLARAALDDAGIRFFLKGEGSHAVFGMGTVGSGNNPAGGPVEIQVMPSESESAKEILSEILRSMRSGEGDTEFPSDPDYSAVESFSTNLPPEPWFNPRKIAFLVVVAVLLAIISGYLLHGVPVAFRSNPIQNLNDYLNTAEACIFRGEFDSAISLFSEVINLNPGEASAFSGRAYAYFRKKDYQSAVGDCTDAIDLVPNNPDVWALRAASKIELYEIDDALADINQALELEEANAQNHEVRSRLLMAKGQYNEALTDATRSITLDPGLFEGYLQRGRVHAHMGNRSSALADFSRARSLAGPQYEASVLFARASTNLYMEQPADALADINECLTEEPDNISYLLLRAAAYLALHEIEKARQDADTVLKMEPDNAYALSTMGMVFGHTNDFANEEGAFRRALDSSPPRELIPHLQMGLGGAYFWRGSLAAARSAFEMALSLSRDADTEAAARGELAGTLGQMGDLLAADQETSIVMRLLPHNSGSFVCRGDVRRLAGNFSGAHEDFNQAIKLNPRCAEAYGYRGLVYLAEGKQEKAGAAFEKCYEIDPYQRPRFEKLATQIKPQQ
ncbi:MAG: tetratricopeptide repeat protein [Candidatus Sumerlaeaceae bacterium]|nr:tetratricopeptide repeat protein [Candidatus Sumerlaeaceae bacterium]